MTGFRERMRGWIWRGNVFGANKKKEEREQREKRKWKKTRGTFFNIDARKKIRFYFVSRTRGLITGIS